MLERDLSIVYNATIDATTDEIWSEAMRLEVMGPLRGESAESHRAFVNGMVYAINHIEANR